MDKPNFVKLKNMYTICLETEKQNYIYYFYIKVLQTVALKISQTTVISNTAIYHVKHLKRFSMFKALSFPGSEMFLAPPLAAQLHLFSLKGNSCAYTHMPMICDVPDIKHFPDYKNEKWTSLVYLVIIALLHFQTPTELWTEHDHIWLRDANIWVCRQYNQLETHSYSGYFIAVQMIN